MSFYLLGERRNISRRESEMTMRREKRVGRRHQGFGFQQSST